MKREKHLNQTSRFWVPAVNVLRPIFDVFYPTILTFFIPLFLTVFYPRCKLSFFLISSCTWQYINWARGRIPAEIILNILGSFLSLLTSAFLLKFLVFQKQYICKYIYINTYIHINYLVGFSSIFLSCSLRNLGIL